MASTAAGNAAKDLQYSSVQAEPQRLVGKTSVPRAGACGAMQPANMVPPQTGMHTGAAPDVAGAPATGGPGGTPSAGQPGPSNQVSMQYNTYNITNTIYTLAPGQQPAAAGGAPATAQTPHAPAAGAPTQPAGAPPAYGMQAPAATVPAVDNAYVAKKSAATNPYAVGPDTSAKHAAALTTANNLSTTGTRNRSRPVQGVVPPSAQGMAATATGEGNAQHGYSHAVPNQAPAASGVQGNPTHTAPSTAGSVPTPTAAPLPSAAPQQASAHTRVPPSMADSTAPHAHRSAATGPSTAPQQFQPAQRAAADASSTFPATEAGSHNYGTSGASGQPSRRTDSHRTPAKDSREKVRSPSRRDGGSSRKGRTPNSGSSRSPAKRSTTIPNASQYYPNHVPLQDVQDFIAADGPPLPPPLAGQTSQSQMPTSAQAPQIPPGPGTAYTDSPSPSLSQPDQMGYARNTPPGGAAGTSAPPQPRVGLNLGNSLNNSQKLAMANR